MRLTAVLIVLGVGVFSGCGSKQSQTFSKFARSDSRPILSGTLTENVSKLVSDPDTASKCDLELRPIMLEIAKALDSHEKEIKKILELQASSESSRQVQFGPLLIESADQPSDESHGWTKSREGWRDFYKIYRRVRNRPYHKDWIELNRSVRYTLMSDLARQEGQNFFLDKDSANRLQRALSAIYQCINVTNCKTPAFESESVHAWVEKVWGSTQDLNALAASMQEDYTNRYAFNRNPTIQRISREVIELPLVASDFKGFEKIFSDYVEGFWQSSELKLKIRWVESSSPLDFYELLAKPISGERPYVDWATHKVNLYSQIKKTDILHEIGHVLGFNDKYYEVFDPETCTYLTQSNYDDVMSEAATGGVTEEEWRLLKLNYYFTGAPAQQRKPIE